jgi:polyisoprenoid-binding protein YceI
MKTTYQIDPAHSGAHFSIRHMMISNVRGGFSGVTGTVIYDPENPSETVIDAVIDAATLNTLDAQRDAHVKSPDFLGTDQFPTITFKSTKVESVSGGEMKVLGDLTVKGITKPVELDVEGPAPEGKDPYGRIKTGASATAKIKRSDFGISWNAALETGGIVLGDDLKIELEIQLVKAQSASA